MLAPKKLRRKAKPAATERVTVSSITKKPNAIDLLNEAPISTSPDPFHNSLNQWIEKPWSGKTKPPSGP